MKKKKKHNTMVESFLSDIQFSRRTFIKASATTGAAITLGVGLKPELTAKTVILHSRIYEVGISYSGRAYCEGKKSNERILSRVKARLQGYPGGTPHFILLG